MLDKLKNAFHRLTAEEAKKLAYNGLDNAQKFILDKGFWMFTAVWIVAMALFLTAYTGFKAVVIALVMCNLYGVITMTYLGYRLCELIMKEAET